MQQDWRLRMEIAMKAGWLLLAAIHVTPAAVVIVPGLVQKLYGVDGGQDVGLLLVHRGVMFLGVVVVCVFASFRPDARPAASILAGISVLGFLVVYAAAGFPPGALRKIAMVDAVAVGPLAFVAWTAWMGSRT
jgi:hypothetical protein